MATIITITGKKENIEPVNGKVFTLQELQRAVNGYIQIVPINENKLMIVDEEGLLKPYPHINIEASRIAGQRIVGQVVIIDRDQIT